MSIIPEGLLKIAPEVAAALEKGQPVVALESTVITHGLPRPENEQIAEKLERILRESDVVPATIAVLEGELRIGLSREERHKLAHAPSPLKLSRADLAYSLACGKTGGTTVSATMIAAALGGIQVFATGGIGGVHAGATETYDISADLEELARTSVIVVSAGPKAILDIGATLEILETRGVPVIGYRCDHLPAFWSRRSQFPAPLRLDSPEEIARMHKVRRVLGMTGGMLIANPVPEADEVPAQDLTTHIDRANAEARAKGISGKAVTPFLLTRIAELTAGRSLAANLALLENNTRLAAQIAQTVSSEDH